MSAAVEIAHVYGLHKRDGYYALVDRLWPRGVAKATAPFDEWLKDVSPSTTLRKWYGHDPSRFHEFARRYRQELESGSGPDALDRLRQRVTSGPVVLVTATKDLEHSEAAVLQAVLGGSAP